MNPNPLHAVQAGVTRCHGRPGVRHVTNSAALCVIRCGGAGRSRVEEMAGNAFELGTQRPTS